MCHLRLTPLSASIFASFFFFRKCQRKLTIKHSSNSYNNNNIGCWQHNLIRHNKAPSEICWPKGLVNCALFASNWPWLALLSAAAAVAADQLNKASPSTTLCSSSSFEFVPSFSGRCAIKIYYSSNFTRLYFCALAGTEAKALREQKMGAAKQSWLGLGLGCSALDSAACFGVYNLIFMVMQVNCSLAFLRCTFFSFFVFPLLLGPTWTSARRLVVAIICFLFRSRARSTGCYADQVVTWNAANCLHNDTAAATTTTTRLLAKLSFGRTGTSASSLGHWQQRSAVQLLAKLLANFCIEINLWASRYTLKLSMHN